MKEANLITSDRLEIQQGDVVVLGAPWDRGSSYLRGTARGPGRIREALGSPARSLVTESGLDLAALETVHWLGDLDLASSADGLRPLTEATEAVLDAGGRLLTLGGDHAISARIVPAVARRFGKLTVVQIDAHPDLYDVYEGNRDSHACSMARIMEGDRVERLIQIGIRAATPEQVSQAKRFGVEIVDPDGWHVDGIGELVLAGPLYLTLDLDGLDPAFAPGVSHPEPGGLSSRQIIDIIKSLPGSLVAADLVELNPLRDVRGATAILAAKLTKEIVGRMLAGPTP